MKSPIDRIKDLANRFVGEFRTDGGKLNLFGGAVFAIVIIYLATKSVIYDLLNTLLRLCDKKPLPALSDGYIVGLIVLWVFYMLYSLRINSGK